MAAVGAGVTRVKEGNRADLQEALDFAGEGLVKAAIHRDKLDNINAIFDQMRAGKIEGRIVVEP